MHRSSDLPPDQPAATRTPLLRPAHRTAGRRARRALTDAATRAQRPQHRNDGVPDPGRGPLPRLAPSPCHCWCHQEFLTVPEAAAVLRIGRALAYELTARFRVTGGTEGIPVVIIGSHTLRVPTSQLRSWSGVAEGEHCATCAPEPSWPLGA